MRYSKMDLVDGRLVETEVRTIEPSVCPHCIFTGDHYRPDGTCRCDDPDHKEMKEWGYKWRDGQWR